MAAGVLGRLVRPVGSPRARPDATGVPADVAEGDGCRVVLEGCYSTTSDTTVSALQVGRVGAGRGRSSGIPRLGPGGLRDVAGLFAAVVNDERSGELLAARDPLGIYPLFYVETASGLHLSISIDALLALPDVPHALNRVALADHLAHRWPDAHETYYDAIASPPARCSDATSRV